MGVAKERFFLTSKQQQFQKLVECTEQHFLGSLTYFGNGVLQFNMLFRALLSCLVANFDTFWATHGANDTFIVCVRDRSLFKCQWGRLKSRGGGVI